MKSKIKYLIVHLKMNIGTKIITTLSITIYSVFSSQVIIGDDIGTVASAQKSSVLLEFAAGQNKGIILPYTRTIPSGPGLAKYLLLSGVIATKICTRENNPVKIPS